MKTILIFSLLFSLIQFTHGQRKIAKVPDLVPVKESYVLSGKPDSSQYFYFLNGILKEQFDSRRDTLDKLLKSRDELLLHLEKIRKEYVRLLGKMPDRTPLNPVITGRIERSRYSVEKVAFESRPGHHVTALLYIPAGNGPFPAILHLPGHSANAKGRDYYQRIGHNFAINGFVVLQIDPVCQGERCQIGAGKSKEYTDVNGAPMSQNSTGQHELYNEKLLLLGSGMVAWEAWDNIRSIDYLCSRHEVDKEKIGVTGLSGGGTQTTYLIPLDTRIKAAGPSSYIATTEEKYRTIGSQDGCQQLYSEGKLGIEEQDFLFMAAPIPILVLSTYGDFFSYKGSRTAVRELSAMYMALGINGRIKQYATSGEHGMTYRSIDADLKWMSWWLRGDSSAVVCDTLTTEFLTENETNVTTSGQVLSNFENEKSILDYAVEMLGQSEKSRKEFLASGRDRVIKKAMELTGYEIPGQARGGTFKGSFMWEGLKIEKHLISRDRGFGLPALIIKPDKQRGNKRSAIIISGCFGKINELSLNRELVNKKLREGYVVIAIDVTNTGELRTPETGRTYGYEFSLAKMPVYAGKTLLGYRAEDLVIARNYLKRLNKVKNIELFASEQIGPAAIHSAFLDGGFSKLYLRDGPDSWATLVKEPYVPDNIGVIVPCALLYYDLPDMINMMPDTPVEILE